jgi:exopolysaccharide biosynthesis polyprenyl glycosylphosphotransferase
MSVVKKQIRRGAFTLLLDCAAIIASAALAYVVSFHYFRPLIKEHALSPDFYQYAKTLFIILPVYVIVMRRFGLYRFERNIRRIEEMFLIFKSVTFSIILLMALSFFYRTVSYSRIFLIFLWLISIVNLGTARYALIQWIYYQRSLKREVVRVLVVGSGAAAHHLIRWAKNNPHYGRHMIGILTNETQDIHKHVEGVSILGSVETCEQWIRDLHPDEVVLMDPLFSKERTADLIALCEDNSIDFKIGADFYGLIARRVDVEYISTVPLLGFQPLPLDDFWNRSIKRSFDVITTLVLMIIGSPLMVLVMAFIKLEDGGPVFYMQERIGRDEKQFKIVKFRTMKTDAEKETGPVWAKKQDDRRTRMGTFLRRWNLDELPQFINVLKGEMSLVGPRPERPHFVGQFRQSIPRYMMRHKVKSGLTGWAQVNGYRGDTSIHERLKYDLYYMENWSLWMDIKILLMTAVAFKNAY